MFLRPSQKRKFIAFWMLLAKDWYSFAEILSRTIMTEEAANAGSTGAGEARFGAECGRCCPEPAFFQFPAPVLH
jgi:hypothetical protein